MTRVNTELFASTIGGAEQRVLARFVTDEHGLHVERFDRRERRWAQDSSVAGFYTGRDDFAQQITEERARELLDSWGADPALVDAPVVQPASA